MSALAKRQNDHALTVTGDSEWDALVQQAETALESGFLPRSITKPAQAIAVAMAGRELGIPPMTAFRSIHIIEGKPSLSAELMLALAYKRVPGFGHAIIENSAKRGAVEMWRPNTPKQVFEFTIEQASAAGLTNKQVWRAYGFRMLLWRAIKFGVSSIAPDVTLGMPSVDEAEEIAESNRPAPRVVEARPQAQPSDNRTVVEAVVEPLPVAQGFARRLNEAQTMQALADVAADIKRSGATGAMSKPEQDYLRELYGERAKALRPPVVIEPPASTPPAQTEATQDPAPENA